MDDLEELGDEFSDSGSGSGGEEDAGVPDGDVEAGGEEEDDDAGADLDDMLGTFKDATGVRSVTKMRVSSKFIHHMAAVDAALATPRSGACRRVV